VTFCEKFRKAMTDCREENAGKKDFFENEARSELSALIQGEKFLSDGEVPFLPICFTHSVSFPPYVIGL